MMLPPMNRPRSVSPNKPEAMLLDQTTSQNKKQSGKYRLAIILLLVLALVVWVVWKILPYIPGIPQYVTLKSTSYVRSAHVYRYGTAGYNPDQPPLAPEWTSLVIDREKNQAVFQSSAGNQVNMVLGKPQWVQACENQFLVETFPSTQPLQLGSVTFQNPVLVVACEMWAVGQKVRPTRLVIKEGPLPEDHPFYFGMECNPAQEICVSFAEALNELSVKIIAADTRQPLPDAHITISSGLGIQEYDGGFRLPVYAAMQLEYHVSLAGYVEKNGEISNFYGNKLEFMYWTNPDHTQGTGEDIDLTMDGQLLEYSIELVK